MVWTRKELKIPVWDIYKSWLIIALVRYLMIVFQKYEKSPMMNYYFLYYDYRIKCYVKRTFQLYCNDIWTFEIFVLVPHIIVDPFNTVPHIMVHQYTIVPHITVHQYTTVPHNAVLNITIFQEGSKIHTYQAKSL